MCYPPRSPSFYWHIAESCYEEDDWLKNYLREFLPGVECLETEHFPYESNLIGFGLLQRKGINSWKVRLLREIGSKDLIVGFRGTVHFLNWIFDNPSFFFTDPTSLYNDMEYKISKWEQKYNGRVKVLVGHSAGGFHATNVFNDINNLFRITFNAYKAERGEQNKNDINKTWNLRTEGDPVSSKFIGKIIGSVNDRYITVCKGGHGIGEFEKIMKKKPTWNDIAEMRKNKKLPSPRPSPKRIVPSYYPDSSAKISSFNNQFGGTGSSLFESLEPFVSKKNGLFQALKGASEERKEQLTEEIEILDEEIDELKANFSSEVQDLPETQGHDTVSVASQLEKLKGDDQECLTPTEKRDLKLGENIAKYQAVKGIVEIVRGLAECVDPYFGLNNRLVHTVDVSGAVVKCIFEAKQSKVIFDSIFNATTAAGLLSAIQGNPAGLLLLGQQAVGCYSALKELTTLLSPKCKSKKDIAALEDLSKEGEKYTDELFKKFDLLDADQKLQFKEVLENIQSARKEIQVLAEEILHELEETRKEIIGRIISQEGKNFQAETDEYKEDFEKHSWVLKARVHPDQKNIEKFLEYFDITMSQLKGNRRNGSVSSGPLVESSEFVKAPDYFSGLIAKSAGLSNVGNTYLYLQILPSIYPLLKEGFWVENHHSRLLQSVTFAQDVGEDILKFMENFELVIWNCLDEYGALRKQVRDNKDHLKKRRIKFQERWIKQNQVNIDKLRSQLVGRTKFALSDFVHKGKIALNFSKENKREQLAEFHNKISWTSLPSYIVVDIVSEIFSSNYNGVFNNILLAEELFSNRSIISLSKMKSGDASPQLHDLIIEVSKETLSSDLVSRWAIAHSESPFPKKDKEIIWCEINVRQKTIYIPSDSAIQKEDLSKIPSPCEDPDYSSSVSKLYDNHLKLEKSRSRVVLPLEGEHQIPLLFPDNYIAYWEKQTGLFDISAGFFVPFYEFRAEENVWKLNLIFSFVKNGEKPKKYARHVCAQFDKTTVDAFGGNVNELLMQAFSGSEYQLGLPDKESYRLKSGMVAPHETRFPGLFALLQKKPSRSFIFNSAAYDNSVCQALEGMIQNGAIGPELESWAVKTDWTPCEGYFEVAPLLRQKPEVRKNEIEEYKKTYETLLGWSQLTSSLSQKKLQMLMWEKLSLPPPAVVLASPEVLPIDVLGFQSQIEENPSTHIIQMRNELEKLESFLSRLNSPSVGEICNDMLEDRVFC